MTTETVEPSQTEIVTRVGVALYRSDIDAVKRIQALYDLDNFSQAVRRIIRIVDAQVESETLTAI